MSASKHFLHNDGDYTLSKVISQILPSKAKSMDFLVGYFYFSGLKEIYQHIQDKPMRILVGMDMEHDLLQRTSEFDFFSKKTNSSRQESKQSFYDSLRRLFNETEYFESEDVAEAFRIYYQKIKDGSLEIRKTKEPCHAKMYIFSYYDELTEDGNDPGTVITGSSNFTYSGLRSNNEINVRFKDKPEYDDAEEIFNNLWKDAIIVADKEHIEDFEEGVIKHIWYEKLPSPYLLYLRVLYEYFHIDNSKHISTPKEITHDEFEDLRYQVDAIRLAIETINRHNGVIIADVVGLGKSIIGSSVANNLHLRTIIIAPPHLTTQWEDYRTQFGVNARVFSRGNLEKVLDFYKVANRENEQWLILIDEAHAYRNEYIKDYAILHEICKGNKVMLLTATPFNNRPADIYAMIKLFQDPTKTTLQTVDNLGREFTMLITRYKNLNKKQREKTISKGDLKVSIENISENIRRIIGPLVIRRSRLDLLKIPQYKKDLEAHKMDFSDPQPPQIKDYELGDLEELYRYTLKRISPSEKDINNLTADIDDVSAEDLIEDEKNEQENRSGEVSFQATRYKPILYQKDEKIEEIKRIIEDAGLEYNLFLGSQRNLASFMRTMLVHRFESSQAAFRVSMRNMLYYCENIQLWMQKRGKIPVFRKGQLPDVKDLYDSSTDQIEQLWEDMIEDQIQALKARGMFEIPIEFLKEKFAQDLQADINLLKDLRARWEAVPLENDPKLNAFVEILKRQLKEDPKRKIIVFSQFADTVNYLGEKLKEKGLPVFAYTSNQATAKNKEIIRANFDAGYPKHKQLDEYHILVATDAISEGYNLHRAGTVFNYDIPYNPTRIIQRVGRINRINKKVFDKLYIYNYFPTSIGEIETRTKEITTLKMAMIHAIMGEDTKYLTDEEELNSFFANRYKSLMAEQESESWDTPYRALLHEMENTDDMRQSLTVPLRSKIRRLSIDKDSGIIAFAKKGDDFVFKFAPAEGDIIDISPEKGLQIMEATIEEEPKKLSSSFSQRFTELKQILFTHEAESEQDKTKRDALDKVRLILQTGIGDQDYLRDLMTAIEHDSIAGYSLRAINRLRRSDFETLPDIISREYVSAALRAYDNISHGVETLIIAEEIQNINTNPQIEIEFES